MILQVLSNIRFSDWHRILFGSAAPAFLVEVLVRGIVMYVALVVTLRYMGKRMNGQISITELAVMISLGAIISLPVQAPKQGILEGFVLLFLIYVFQRGLATVSFHSHRSTPGLQVYSPIRSIPPPQVIRSDVSAG